MVSISLFDHPWTHDRVPKYIETAAVWQKQPGISFDSVGTRYETAMFPVFSLLRLDEPLAFNDVETDQRLDQTTRSLFLDEFMARSVVFLPLVVGGQWIGYIDIYQDQPFEFAESELRRLMTLVGQAAVAVQSIRQLQSIQSRAQREQQLREISERLRSQPDVDGVLRALARELGQVLGRRTFVGMSHATAAQPRVQEDA
jgi:GAF domain-containing protein